MSFTGLGFERLQVAISVDAMLPGGLRSNVLQLDGTFTGRGGGGGGGRRRRSGGHELVNKCVGRGL